MCAALETAKRQQHRGDRTLAAGFTLVEMLVTIVIMSMLGTLALSGMAVARQRARIDRTRTTIRKISEALVPHALGYVNRRVSTVGIATPSQLQCPTCYAPSDPPGFPSRAARVAAWKVLIAKRALQIYEMPDSWSDVRIGTGIGDGVLGLPACLRTVPVIAYASMRAALIAQSPDPLNPRPTAQNGSAECLYMTLSRGGMDTDVMDHFRPDELGDVDADGVPEFLDAWGQPIIFLRWAPGFSRDPIGATGSVRTFSPIQIADPANYHDPMDPLRVDESAYALTPLVVSGGPDRLPGLNVLSDGWTPLFAAPGLQSLQGIAAAIGSPATVSPDAYRDNITNHALIAR